MGLDGLELAEGYWAFGKSVVDVAEVSAADAEVYLVRGELDFISILLLMSLLALKAMTPPSCEIAGFALFLACSRSIIERV